MKITSRLLIGGLGIFLIYGALFGIGPTDYAGPAEHMFAVSLGFIGGVAAIAIAVCGNGPCGTFD